MKKIICFVSVLLINTLTFNLYAQSKPEKGEQSTNSSQKAQKDLDWYNCSEKEGSFGADVNGAYEILGKRKAKYSPVVAIISGGIDYKHKAIKPILWKNKKEKINGKDNDKNGFIDDINGWNFISSKDGKKTMEFTIKEGDREWLRLKDQYHGVYSGDGKNFVKFDKDGTMRGVEIESINDYYYYRDIVSNERSARVGDEIIEGYLRYWIKEFERRMKEKNPDKEDFNHNDLVACWDKSKPLDTLMSNAMYIFGMYMQYKKVEKWSYVSRAYTNDSYYDNYREQTKKGWEQLNDKRKEIVGDDYNNINDIGYGSNVLLTTNSKAVTCCAGIIAGKRGIKGQNSPICEKARIMPLVVSALKGEPYTKDIALAIRYAVDNGADIIVLPDQRFVYSPNSKKWIGEALRYAESKGVLAIVSTLEYGANMDIYPFYPNRKMVNGTELSNLIVVSGSDKLGNPVMFSNFGETMVDFYAPTVDIYSSFIGDDFSVVTSSMLSSAVTAGVAALVKAYYPNLNAAQIRKLLMDNVSSLNGVEVEKGFNTPGGKKIQDLFLFEQLCKSGGIINAKKAIEAAAAIK